MNKFEILSEIEIDQISGARFGDNVGAVFGFGVGVGLSYAGVDPITSGVMSTGAGYAVSNVVNDISDSPGGGGT